jgi:hypothetical protein
VAGGGLLARLMPRGRLLAPVPAQDHGVGVVGRCAGPLPDVVLALDQGRLAATLLARADEVIE